MRYCIVVLVGLFLSGCATAPSDLNKVSMGMTKEQVVASVGPPQSTRITQGVEYLIYHCREVSVGRQLFMAREGIAGEVEADYYVRLVNGRVDASGKLGDFDSTHIPEAKLDISLSTRTDTPSHNQTISPRTILQQGMDALEKKDYGTALLDFNIEAAANPSSTEAWYGIGFAHFDLGEYADSLTAFKRVVEIDPKQQSAWGAIAGAYYHLKQFDNYKDALNKLRELNPQKADEAQQLIEQGAVAVH